MSSSATLHVLGQGRETESPSWQSEELTVTAFHDPPYFFIDRQPNGTFEFSGYIFELWQMLAHKLRLNYRIVPLFSGGFGNLGANGTWGGMTGELAYGRADVALTWLGMTPERAKVVDFADAVPLSSYHNTFFVSSQTEEAHRISTELFGLLLKPLHVYVWWTLLAALLGVAGALGLSLCVQRKLLKREVNEDEDMSLGSSIFSCLMSILRQGWVSTPRTASARIMFLVAWLLSIIIYISYTANLMSHLTVPIIHRPIETLKQFLELPNWKIAMEPGAEDLDRWAGSANMDERKVRELVLQGDRYLPVNLAAEQLELLQLVGPEVLLFLDGDRMHYALGSAGCHTHMVPLNDPTTTDFPRQGYLAFAKGRRSLRQAVNKVMLKMRSAGVISRLRKRWPKRGMEKCGLSSGFRALSFRDMLAVLIVVPLATIFSVAILGTERISSSKHTGRDEDMNIFIKRHTEPFRVSSDSAQTESEKMIACNI